MLHPLFRWFYRSAVPAALALLSCSGVVSAQLLQNATSNRAQVAAARKQARQAQQTQHASKLQGPADTLLIPYLKAHGLKTSGTTTAPHPLDTGSTSYVTTPQFGGFVNPPTFDVHNSFSVSEPEVELGADFDKDGKTDIASLQGDGTLSILINDGKSGLKASVTYINPDSQTSSVFTAQAVDINGDGYPDIVAYDAINNTTITWMNLGNGTFNAAVTTPLDATYGVPSMVYLADINGDGKADLIFANLVPLSPTNAAVYLETQLGAGNGTFGSPTAAKVESFTFSGTGSLPIPGITVGDINGDGKMDIALVLDEQPPQAAGEFVVTTALGNNDGTFTGLGQTSPIAISVTSVNGQINFYTSILTFVDLNGDGKVDLVADINGDLSTAFGNGDGTFSKPVIASAVTASALQTVLLDVNGDGKADAIFASGGTLSVLLGNGDGTFAQPVAGAQYINGDSVGPQSMVVADFNNDGVEDIAELDDSYQQVYLLFNTGKGVFNAAQILTSENDPIPFDTKLITAGKYTANGFSSTLVDYTGGTSDELVTVINNGKGGFTSVQALATYPANLAFFQTVHADFNGDGLEDIVYVDTAAGVWVALSKGDGTFATPVSVGLPAAPCILGYAAAGDLNGDGKVDLVVPYLGDFSCGAGTNTPSGYYVSLGNGDGTFRAPKFVPAATELYSVALGDFNGDGRLDLVLNDVPFAYGTGYQVSIASGNGDGNFNPPNSVLQNYLVSDIAVADIDNDGKLDLILSAGEISLNRGANEVDSLTGGILTLTNNSKGTFNTPTLIAPGNWFTTLDVTDINNDGNADIVAALFSTSGQPLNYYGMVALLGYGNGQFAAPYNSPESLNSTTPLVGHFVNSVAFDVLTQDFYYGVGLFVGQGGSTLALSTAAPSISVGNADTLTATLTASTAGRPVATGTVSFYDGTTLLGTETLSAGVATLTTTSLTAGTHTIKALYSGDSNFNPASSATSTITVAAVAPAFTLSNTPSAVSITGGAQGLVTLNLAANGSFSGAITFACEGLPAGATCAVNPNSVTLTANGSSTVTLVIGTTGTHAALNRTTDPWEVPAEVASLATLFGIFFGRRKHMRLLAALGLGLTVSVGTLLTGCTNIHLNSNVPFVSPGAYSITVTATPSSGSGASVQTTTIAMTVN